MVDCLDPKHTRNNRYLLDASDESFSCSENPSKKTTKTARENFQTLYSARHRFCDFVKELGQCRFNQIREDILSHCEMNSKKEQIYYAKMSDETILKMMNFRIQKMIKNKRIKRNWSDEDVQILIWIISMYADKKGLQDLDKEMGSEDWEALASIIPGATGQSCMFKWLSLKKINLATNNWSEEESNLLAKIVDEKGYEGKIKDTKDWKTISQKLYFINKNQDKIFRNAKQCRQHWSCFLNPTLKKGPWKPEEDIQLLKCVKQNNGLKKWSQIVKNFDGRTQNALKNRFTLIIDKEKKHNKHKTELQLIDEYLLSCYVDIFTTQIKQNTQQEDREDSVISFGQKIKEDVVSIDDLFQTQQKGETQHSGSHNIVSCSTSITSIKIQNFGELLSFLSSKKIDLNQIQCGTLNNGIFQKNQGDSERTSIQEIPLGKLRLKKYSSSCF